MLTSVLTRALPFIMTLMLGTGLGSIFGFKNSTTKPACSDAPRFMRGHGGGGGGGGYNSGGGVRTGRYTESSALNITFQPNTSYTQEALEHKTTGVVTLLVQFNPDGTTKVIERVSTLPYGLTEDAERVVKQTRFVPARLNGRLVSETKLMDFPYSLSDRATSGL